MNDSQTIDKEYKYGFTTDIAMEQIAKGLNADVIRKISSIKDEPEWMLKSRLRSFKIWQKMTEPLWAKVNYEPVDYQDISYYSAPKSYVGTGKQKEKPKSLDDLDPELVKTFERLGISLN